MAGFLSRFGSFQRHSEPPWSETLKRIRCILRLHKLQQKEETIIKASVGEVIELPNVKIKVKELVQTEEVNTVRAKDGTRFVFVYLDIYTDAIPKHSLNWMIDKFFDAFVLSDGREIKSFGLSDPYIEPGTWNEKHVGLKDLEKQYDVVGVIVRDPIDHNIKARVDF